MYTIKKYILLRGSSESLGIFLRKTFLFLSVWGFIASTPIVTMCRNDPIGKKLGDNSTEAGDEKLTCE